jgi:multisubunit Na+/H+ antiporter MnhE subunit
MKNNDAAKLGLAVLTYGWMLVTTSHYWEVWYFGYATSIFAAILFPAVFSDGS